MKPSFESTEQVLEHFGGLFERVGADPEAAPLLRRENLRLALRFHEPEACLLLQFAQGELSVRAGEEAGQQRANLTIEATADAMDELLSGKKDLKSLVGGGAIRVQGNFLRLFGLAPLLELAARLYTSDEAP